MKKIFNLLKPKKDEAQQDEELKYPEESNPEQEISTKDKDSNSNSDD